MSFTHNTSLVFVRNSIVTLQFRFSHLPASHNISVKNELTTFSNAEEIGLKCKCAHARLSTSACGKNHSFRLWQTNEIHIQADEPILYLASRHSRYRLLGFNTRKQATILNLISASHLLQTLFLCTDKNQYKGKA